MEFEINDNSPAPGYVQLASELRTRIRDGRITDWLPSLTKLCGPDWGGLSLSTVQHAIRVLKDEGLVESVKGRGTFVKR